eukprot:NODE_4853_length_332_cov_359.844523_g4242_i0.p1 GENE.NODE_4853_length_332_cov_359.844523_g4242_i0~~NODE_4853_length_332_cov_359.844523_g4242_i0.p1  ORF type:complete len:79 (+),score=26.19 NODE_4853_length_332_cov_359.844523_g4242_i0:26-238(+)
MGEPDKRPTAAQMAADPWLLDEDPTTPTGQNMRDLRKRLTSCLEASQTRKETKDELKLLLNRHLEQLDER